MYTENRQKSWVQQRSPLERSLTTFPSQLFFILLVPIKTCGGKSSNFAATAFARPAAERIRHSQQEEGRLTIVISKNKPHPPARNRLTRMFGYFAAQQAIKGASVPVPMPVPVPVSPGPVNNTNNSNNTISG